MNSSKYYDELYDYALNIVSKYHSNKIVVNSQMICLNV